MNTQKHVFYGAEGRYVAEADFDRVTAERDALQQRLNELGEQRQGEPVAWVRFRNGEPDYDGDACMIMNVPGDTLGDGDSWEPVYTRADPGEVERLRADIARLDKENLDISLERKAALEGWDKSMDECDTLRAQLAELEALHGGELGLPKEGWPEYHKRKMESLRDLAVGRYERKLAERDALLREIRRKPGLFSGDFILRLDEILSASAEPRPFRIPDCPDCACVQDGQCLCSPSKPSAEPSEPAAKCTNEDSWNCKYCRNTEGCEALKDPRNFGEPSAPATLCASELGFHAETGTCEAKAIIGRIKDLGITYFRCMPDRFGDCLWFFNCRNVPSVLPEWLVVKSSTAKDWVGSGGMTEEIARKIEEDAGKYRSAPAEADEASACSSCDGSGVDLWRGGRDPWGRASSCTVCNGSGKAPDLVGVPRDVIEDIVEDAVNGRVISVDDLDELRSALERKP